jgi:hypothetical protein
MKTLEETLFKGGSAPSHEILSSMLSTNLNVLRNLRYLLEPHSKFNFSEFKNLHEYFFLLHLKNSLNDVPISLFRYSTAISFGLYDSFSINSLILCRTNENSELSPEHSTLLI